MGYWQAGFDVTGVDIVPRPRYPFPFVQADAIDYVREHGQDFDLVHASPPCQAYCTLTKGTHRDRENTHPELYEPIRDALLAVGVPWVIENPAARPDVVLCGTQFGLPILRHRNFEVGGWFPLAHPHTRHAGRVRGWRHGTYYEGPYFAAYGNGGGKADVPELQAALGIDWTDHRDELVEAIPPAYTRFLGEQAAAQLSAKEMAAVT
jgi:DNA (cytosine-5)-methyltransferase 1